LSFADRGGACVASDKRFIGVAGRAGRRPSGAAPSPLYISQEARGRPGERREAEGAAGRRGRRGGGARCTL
jgi:hypothetical protein